MASERGFYLAGNNKLNGCQKNQKKNFNGEDNPWINISNINVGFPITLSL